MPPISYRLKVIHVSWSVDSISDSLFHRYDTPLVKNNVSVRFPGPGFPTWQFVQTFCQSINVQKLLPFLFWLKLFSFDGEILRVWGVLTYNNGTSKKRLWMKAFFNRHTYFDLNVILRNEKIFRSHANVVFHRRMRAPCISWPRFAIAFSWFRHLADRIDVRNFVPMGEGVFIYTAGQSLVSLKAWYHGSYLTGYMSATALMNQLNIHYWQWVILMLTLLS